MSNINLNSWKFKISTLKYHSGSKLGLYKNNFEHKISILINEVKLLNSWTYWIGEQDNLHKVKSFNTMACRYLELQTKLTCCPVKWGSPYKWSWSNLNQVIVNFK